jgi:hypothetical protein
MPEYNIKINLSEEESKSLKYLLEERNFCEELSNALKHDIGNFIEEIHRDEQLILKAKDTFPLLFSNITNKSFDRAKQYKEQNKPIVIDRKKGRIYKNG